jgi:oxygen-dependent protoporphyrinogen oxidase
VEYLLEPPLAGVFYWTPEQTSAAMFFLLLKVAPSLKLLTLEGGLERLPAELASRLNVRCDADVLRVSPRDDGGYSLRVQQGGTEQELLADGLVCAIPGCDVPRIVPDLSEAQLAFFGQVRYAATAVTALGVAKQPPSRIHSFFCPRREMTYLGAVTTASGRSRLTAPQHDVYTLFAKGAAGPGLLATTDASIHALLRSEFEKTAFATAREATVAFHHEYRWERAVPDFETGSLLRLREFASGRLERGRLVFAGDYLGGPFVEGAVVSGQAAARRLLRRLATH